MTKITVITITLNVAEALRRTIESVNEQSYSEIEHVIVDGGSNDGSTEIISHIARRKPIWISEPDKGIADAFNKGTRLGSGDYLCYLNAGDVFANADVLSSVAQRITDDPGVKPTVYIGNFFSERADIRFFHQASAAAGDFEWRNPINHQSAFIPRSIARDHEYDARLRLGMDYDFWLRVAKHVRFVPIDIPVAVFASDGRSSDPKWAVHNLVTRRILWHINRGTRIEFGDLSRIWFRGFKLWIADRVKTALGKKGMRLLRIRKAKQSMSSNNLSGKPRTMRPSRL